MGYALLSLEWEEELARLHELYYPDKQYVSSDLIKETDQAMKEQAAKAGNTAFGLSFVLCAAMIVIQSVIICYFC